MIRQPTDPYCALDWWRAAMSGRRRPTHESEPHAGYYKMRLVKNGPWMPVRIWWHSVVDQETGELTEPERMLCLVGERERDIDRTWLSCCKNPISRPEYEAMMHTLRWAGSNDPTHPMLRPMEPIDLTRRLATP